MDTLSILADIISQTSVDPNLFNDFMLLGYGVMWLTVMVYIAILANRQRNVRQDLKLLRQLLEEDEEADDE